MARFALFLVLILFCASCAEVIPLTGGDEDEYAPKIKNQYPEQGALNVSSNQVEIELDEYFKLNDPANSVTMNPSVGKLTTVSKNKTVSVSWDSILSPNTTYILQLNGTIRDLNEGNDTILQIVFSSGNTIDSLAISGFLQNAFTNTPFPKSTVCLFQPNADIYSSSALYLSQSDTKGLVTFSYLRPGNYKLIAFNDENKDQLIGKTEPIGFSDSLVVAGDSTPFVMRMFTPKLELNRLQVKIETPGLARISGKDFSKSSILINGLAGSIIKTYRSDSLLVALPSIAENTYQFVNENDTVVRTLSKEEKLERLKIEPFTKKLNWRRNDTLFFSVNALIDRLDTNSISIQTDSKQKGLFTSNVSDHVFYLAPQFTKSIEPFTIQFKRGFVRSNTGNLSDSITFNYSAFDLSDCATLVLDCESLSGNWIVELTDGESVIASQLKNTSQRKITFNRLIPGKYTVRCVEDRNNNGVWDTGNEQLHQQPEQVVRFEIQQKLRPNWEVEEVLKLKNDQ